MHKPQYARNTPNKTTNNVMSKVQLSQTFLEVEGREGCS